MSDKPAPGSAEEAAARRQIGKGPFIVASYESGDASVRDASGNEFCWVCRAACAGGDKAAAKARATRIAESLNLTEVR